MAGEMLGVVYSDADITEVKRVNKFHMDGFRRRATETLENDEYDLTLQKDYIMTHWSIVNPEKWAEVMNDATMSIAEENPEEGDMDLLNELSQDRACFSIIDYLIVLDPIEDLRMRNWIADRWVTELDRITELFHKRYLRHKRQQVFWYTSEMPGRGVAISHLWISEWPDFTKNTVSREWWNRESCRCVAKFMKGNGWTYQAVMGLLEIKALYPSSVREIGGMWHSGLWRGEKYWNIAMKCVMEMYN